MLIKRKKRPKKIVVIQTNEKIFSIYHISQTDSGEVLYEKYYSLFPFTPVDGIVSPLNYYGQLKYNQINHITGFEQ